MNDEKNLEKTSFTDTLQSYVSGQKEAINENSLGIAARIKTNQAQKLLNETGLQNVFDTYDKQTKELARQKQLSQEDAVFVREMSKKYLGEYASNLGIGDVSGNLLDIHSNYQSNLRAIDEDFLTRGYQLDQNYQVARMEHLEKVFQAQLGIELAEIDLYSQNIIRQIATGEIPEGMDELDFLKSEKDNMNPAYYNVFYQELYNQMVQEAQESFANNYYGFERDAEGNLVPITDFEQYLAGERFKNLSTRDRNAFREANEFKNYIEQQISTKDIANKFIYDEDGNKVENPDYIGDKYDYELMTGEKKENLSLGTTAFVDSTGTRRFGVSQTVDQEKRDSRSNYNITTTEITEEYEMQNEGELPNEGATIDLMVSERWRKQKNVDATTEKATFIFFNGSWHRLINEKTYSDAEMRFWNSDNKKDLPAGVDKIKKDSITINGTKYKKDEKMSGKSDTDYATIDAVRKKIEEIYLPEGFERTVKEEKDGKTYIVKNPEISKYIPDHTFVIYNGVLYKWEKGTIYTTKK